MFYVYEWFIIKTNEIIYVGKGSKKRYKVKKHNSLFNEFIKRFECSSRIVKWFESEEEAFKYEYQRINELWQQNQCVCNIYKGGLGGTTEWWTQEKRNWYSKNNCMKSEEQRKRMSVNNPMKNKEIALRVNEKNKRKVIINNKEYSSVLDVCKEYNTCYETVKNWCTKGINKLGELCRYADEEQVIRTQPCYENYNFKEIVYKNKKYSCAKEMSKELKISINIVYRWCQKGFDNVGNPCRYLIDDRILSFKKLGENLKKPIIVNGIFYESKTDAEKSLGIKPGGLAPYIKGIRKNNKYICEYVNQQPSHENSSKSIVEGSTTNE